MALSDKELASTTTTLVTEEKEEHLEQQDHLPRPPSPHESIDLAYQFLKQHSHIADPRNEERIKILLWRVDAHIVPVMFACYTMQFLDKVLINYAAVMGINKDLNLKGNDFTNAATAFFIAYLIAEAPNGLALQKFPAAKWLSFNVIAWGIVCACTAATHNYHTLLVARIFLGIFEAAIAPCLMLLSSMWYTRAEQAPRFSFWYCGLGFGQILGGIVSYGFQHVHHKEIAGWRIMFVVLGLVTVVVGVITGVLLPDTPMNAWWLTNEEKVWVVRRVRGNRTGISKKGVRWQHVVELVLDPQIWLLTLMTILISISSGVITTYSSTIIKSFGYTAPISALLNAPSGIVSIASTLIVGFGVRNASHRWSWIVACCIPGIIGGGLLSFSPKRNRAALLAGIYMVNAIVATLTVIYQWTIANCAGNTKRVLAAALVAGAFSVGNIIGPQTFQARDAPDYKPAKIAVLATQAGGAVVATVLSAYYVWANKKKEAAAAAEEKISGEKDTKGEVDMREEEVEGWRNLTDRQDKAFRYVY
ncbi:hypothetical protein GP486_001230 [Trichoglossum hirsutum]|uniref:Major facilitator superfamily (MFS) profile domain-containing protein n=1 Tax=Trichoglossum hirsutum TaxID=265104 RepID=A0A9P8RSW4_9PEZI|nr:hypothetical protein GP486_001230 [Trichoglossum hirsutum]